MLFLEMGKCFFDFFWWGDLFGGGYTLSIWGFGDGFIWILDFWFLGGFCGMKEIKKSGGGDVRAKALAWDDEWDKA